MKGLEDLKVRISDGHWLHFELLTEVCSQENLLQMHKHCLNLLLVREGDEGEDIDGYKMEYLKISLKQKLHKAFGKM